MSLQSVNGRFRFTNILSLQILFQVLVTIFVSVRPYDTRHVAVVYFDTDLDSDLCLVYRFCPHISDRQSDSHRCLYFTQQQLLYEEDMFQDTMVGGRAKGRHVLYPSNKKKKVKKRKYLYLLHVFIQKHLQCWFSKNHPVLPLLQLDRQGWVCRQALVAHEGSWAKYLGE